MGKKLLSGVLYKQNLQIIRLLSVWALCQQFSFVTVTWNVYWRL